MTGIIPADTSSRTGYDFAGLLDLVGGDREFLDEFIALFEQDSRQLIDEIHEATTSHDQAALTRSAHALRGLLAHFGESAALDHCRFLEALGSSQNAAEAETLAYALDSEINVIRQGLAQLARSSDR